jgi:hypothetical protein
MSTTSHLRSVKPGESPEPVEGLPDFEGQDVVYTRIRLAGANKLEAGDLVSRIDDTVRLYVEGQVTRIDHVVDPPSGRLMRIHTVKVVDAMQLPWDFDTTALDT